MVLGTQTWRQYYFCRSELEFRVESGRPRDFISKAISGHAGMNVIAMSTPTAHPLLVKSQGIVASQLMAWQVPLDECRACWMLCHGRKEWMSPPFQSRLENSNRASQASGYNWVLLSGMFTHQLPGYELLPVSCTHCVPETGEEEQLCIRSESICVCAVFQER